MAYGDLGLEPEQFARMTPREFRLRLQGHERQWEHLAHLVTWMVQGDYKTALTPDVLLQGRPAPPTK